MTFFAIAIEADKNDHDAVALPYPSEPARDSALDWVQSQSKKQAVAYCRARGFDIMDSEGSALCPAWVSLTAWVRSWDDVGQLSDARDMITALWNSARETKAAI